jgi:predicted NodU family carbamoyl transferase
MLKDNLHIGVDDNFLREADEMDIAASAQEVVEQLIEIVIKKAKKLGKSENIVYGGGVALNCLANRLIGQYYENIWIMPNPGDAGNSLGAAALGYGKKLNWTNAFLGFNIDGEYPVDNIFKELYNLDHLRPLFWRSWLLIILTCLAAGVTVGICKSSLLVGILTYFLLSFTLTGLLVFRLLRMMDRASENS